jgi:Na+/phosphate symporter
MLLVKQFDTRKRSDERRKKLEELRVEREKEKERRMETRRMELEILSEMKRPVEDMAVPDPRYNFY